MANDSMFQGATPNTGPTRPISGTDEPRMDHDAPPGMDPSRAPSEVDNDRPEDWMDPEAAEDVPAADEPTPLSDDRR
jgi:hypothetical protein